MRKKRVFGLVVGAVCLGMVAGLLSLQARPVRGTIVDKAYEDQASTAVVTVLVGHNEYETVRAPAHELVACYVSRSSPVRYPECVTAG